MQRIKPPINRRLQANTVVLKRLTKRRCKHEKDNCRSIGVDLHIGACRLANLLLHTNGYDSFVRIMVENNYNTLKKYILKSSKKMNWILDEKTEIYIRIYCLGTVNLNCEWILGKSNVSPEELAEVYWHSLPGPLYQYLL